MSKIYGIDLGTTNSCISVLKDGKPYTIPVDGNGIVPSVVSFDGANLLVGRKAWNRAAAFPDQSVRSVKRLMGTTEKLYLGNKEYEPEAISAMILRYLCEEAHKIEGHTVERAVITVPAYFSDAQRRATMEAGKRAGLTVERIINEPTAAALFYDHVLTSSEDSESQTPGEHYALVYDLGGGTFDVSVLHMGEIIEVLASTGDTHLGGDDFDRRIVLRLLQEIKERENLDLENYVPALARLSAVAEQVKISLSEKASVWVEETRIPTPKGKSCTVSMELSREEFEAMTEDFLDRTVASVEKAMKEANLSVDKIGKVLLVGGMTRMPLISARLEQIFGSARMPVVDPDLSVANGASIQGGIISGENCDQILIDVTPHTLSLETLSYNHGVECAPIIPRNTQIPVTRARTFATVAYHQKIAELKIYQGESLFPEDNTLIGETHLELAPAEAHCPILLEYSYDLNGIVHLVAEQKGYSRKTEIRIDSRNPQLFSSRLQEIEEGEACAKESADATNFVTQRARKLISKMEAGEKKDILTQTLAQYEKLLLDNEEIVDAIEDTLLDLIEEISAEISAKK